MRVSSHPDSPFHFRKLRLCAPIHVTLDGRAIDGVVQADDEDGWVDVLRITPDGLYVIDRSTGEVERERKHGVVRMYLGAPLRLPTPAKAAPFGIDKVKP